MSKVIKFIITSIYLCILYNSSYASVIPGTIKIGTNNTSVSCGVQGHSYNTSHGCTTAGQCNWSRDSWDIYGNPTSGSFKSSGGETYWVNSTSYNDYLSNNSTVISYNGVVKLSIDTQNCNPRVTGVSSSANYAGSLSCNGNPCGNGGGGSIYSPTHGYCSSATSVKTIINNNYDQLGNRTYQYNNNETTIYNSSQNSNLTATCTIEGRFADADNSAPVATINGVSNIFSSDNNQWCNIDKYLQNGYTYKADENPGCEYYRKLNTTGNPGNLEDLLKGLEINIPGDDSGIGYVEIQLGKCNGNITPINSSLSEIIVSSTSPSGVKSQYKNGFVLKYDTGLSLSGRPSKSIKNILNVDRLDKCLGEGKNSLTIIIKDMARSEVDGKDLSANTGNKFTVGTINIDNSTPKLDLIGDVNTTSLTGNTLGGGFLNLINNDGTIWRNYTLSGVVKSLEKYNGGKENECKNFTGGLTGQCSGSLPTGGIWTAPSGVDPNNGKFMQFMCDGAGPFPESAECGTGCPVGKKLNNTKTECIPDTCSNGEMIGGVCINYCIPNHTVDCIVRDSGVGVPPSTPTNPTPPISGGENIILDKDFFQCNGISGSVKNTGISDNNNCIFTYKYDNRYRSNCYEYCTFPDGEGGYSLIDNGFGGEPKCYSYPGCQIGPNAKLYKDSGYWKLYLLDEADDKECQSVHVKCTTP